MRRACLVDGCERNRVGRGLCGMHYQRLCKHGHVGPPGPYPTTGEHNGHWKGGRIRGGHEGRYWMVHLPDHPNANSNGYVLEHRVVMERKLGRRLGRDEIVHHLNHDPSDNRPENLEVMAQPDHARQHMLERHAS